MKTYHVVIPLPQAQDPELEPPTPTGDPEQDAWTDRTTALLERFIAAHGDNIHHDPAIIALVVHATSDVLFERLGAGAGWDKLDPAALIGIVVRTLPAAVGAFSEVLHDFYAFLTAAGELEAERGRYLACYFETLLELHGAGSGGMLPSRASRRATATLARRITEARLRNEERAARKPAA